MGELENKMTAERSGQMSDAELRWRLLKVETGDVLRGIGERLKERPESFLASLVVLSGGLAGPIKVIAQSTGVVAREVPIEAQSTKEVEAIVAMANEARQVWAVGEIAEVQKIGARMDGSAEKATPVASQERDESELEDFRLIQIDPDEWREACKVVYRSSPEEWQDLGTSFKKEVEKLSRWGRGPLGGSPLPGKGAMLATENMVKLLKQRGITIEDCSDKFKLVAIREGEKASQAAIRCGYTPGSLAFFNGALNSSHLDRNDVGVLIVPDLPQWEIKTGFGGPVLKSEEILAGIEETMRREFSEGGHQVIELSAVANGGDEAIPVMVIDSRLIRRVNPDGEQTSLKRVDGEVHAGVVGGTLWKIEVKRMESVAVYMENDIPIKDPVAKVSNRNGNPVRWVNLITGEEGKWGEWPPVAIVTPEPTVAPEAMEMGPIVLEDRSSRMDVRWKDENSMAKFQRAFLLMWGEKGGYPPLTVEEIEAKLARGEKVTRLMEYPYMGDDDKDGGDRIGKVDLSKPVKIVVWDREKGFGPSQATRLRFNVENQALTIFIYSNIFDKSGEVTPTAITSGIIRALEMILNNGDPVYPGNEGNLIKNRIPEIFDLLASLSPDGTRWIPEIETLPQSS